jgi:hypothetical protein
LVEVRETIEEIRVPRFVEEPAGAAAVAARAKAPLFANVPEDDLLRYGVPPEWMADVRAADEDTLLELAGHLPAGPPRRCSIWLWAPCHGRRSWCPLREIRLRIRTPSADSG